MTQLFTLEQANAAVQQIRLWMKEILDIRQHILDRQADLWQVMKRLREWRRPARQPAFAGF